MSRISAACILLEKFRKTWRPLGILCAEMDPQTTPIALGILIFRVYHMFNATLTKRNDSTNTYSKKKIHPSTLKAEKANKGHENSIDPELGQKGQLWIILRSLQVACKKERTVLIQCHILIKCTK